MSFSRPARIDITMDTFIDLDEEQLCLSASSADVWVDRGKLSHRTAHSLRLN